MTQQKNFLSFVFFFFLFFPNTHKNNNSLLGFETRQPLHIMRDFTSYMIVRKRRRLWRHLAAIQSCDNGARLCDSRLYRFAVTWW